MLRHLKITFTVIILTFFFPSISLQAKELTPGLIYTTHKTTAGQHIHVLEVDPSQLHIASAHANAKAFGRETVADIAKNHHAIAAVNGGFFLGGEATEGLPAGILKIQDNWYGIAYKSRGAIGWSKDPASVIFDRVQTKTTVFLNRKKFPIYAVNKPGLASKTVLYTDAYGKKAGSLENGWDIIIQNNRIVKIIPGGNTIIPKGGYIYSIGPKSKLAIHALTLDQPATVNIEVLPHFSKEQYLGWQKVENIVGGIPLLLSNGKIIHENKEVMRSAFINKPYARTAVGILKNGHWIFVVAEQNAITNTIGLTIPELASFMQELGCEYALNLDGGGSSTLYINNAIVNRPEEDEDYGIATIRPVSDAILILPKH